MKVPVKIRPIYKKDRFRLEAILKAQTHFKPAEIEVALELIDIVLTVPRQEDYRIRCIQGADGEVRGYICYGKAPLTESTYDLYWIVVHPIFWNQGAGSSLIQHAEEDLRQRDARLLLIETSSLPSYERPRAFYKKHGYQEQACIFDYYALGDHKLIFGKILTPGGDCAGGEKA
jgi:ribosomal protein S18 acetylase RimI-like enzyme